MKVLVARLKILFLVLIFFVVLSSIWLGVESRQKGSTFVIGAKSCTEQHLLGEIFATLLEKNTELKVVRRFNLEGTTICFNALKTGAIDTYFEYTGTALLDILKEPLIENSLYSHVKEAFEDKYGITWLAPVGFSNQYILIVRADSPVRKISELSSLPNLRIAFDPEFSSRLELKLLKDAYPASWHSKLMDPVLLYFSLLNREVDVISGASTDGRLADEHFVVLEDDRQCLPKYEVAPILKQSTVDKFPEVIEVLRLLIDTITDEEMMRLNYEVEIQKKPVQQVACEFIEKITN